MGFGTNLAKGFIRSAVNQVGRDGGRVVSNKVYGDKHSIPIRHVGSQNTEIDRNELVEINDQTFIRVVLSFLACAILPFLGSAIYIYQGIKFLQKKEVILYKAEQQPVYSNDKRYKGGTRFDGYRNINIPIKIIASETERKKMKTKGFMYFIIGLSFLIFYTYLFFI